MYDSHLSVYKTKNKMNLNHLTNIKEKNNNLTGEICIIGNLKNLRIKQTNFEILIVGSIAKYYFGNNLKIINRQETKKAFEKISDEICLDIQDARIYELEFAGNMAMDNHVDQYLQSLDYCKKFEKGNYKNTIYYSHYLKDLIFYNKTKEYKDKKIKIPEDFRKYENRILRYELRYKPNLKKQFGFPIFVRSLFENTFYNYLLNEWKNYYFSIFKKKIIIYPLKEKLTPRSYINYLVAKNINLYGFQNSMNEINLNIQNFTNYQGYNRIKRTLRLIASKYDCYYNSDLIKELDNKVLEIVDEFKD